MHSRRTVNLLGALGVALADGQQRAMREASHLADSEVAALNVVGDGQREGGGPSIGEVRAALDLTHPGTVRVVDRLVARGLVLRRPGSDGRRVALRLTADGETAFLAQQRARTEWLAPFAAALGPDADARLEALLLRVEGTVDDGEHVCRLCDEQACPQDRCPVTIAVGGQLRRGEVP